MGESELETKHSLDNFDSNMSSFHYSLSLNPFESYKPENHNCDSDRNHENHTNSSGTSTSIQ